MDTHCGEPKTDNLIDLAKHRILGDCRGLPDGNPPGHIRGRRNRAESGRKEMKVHSDERMGWWPGVLWASAGTAPRETVASGGRPGQRLSS